MLGTPSTCHSIGSSSAAAVRTCRLGELPNAGLGSGCLRGGCMIPRLGDACNAKRVSVDCLGLPAAAAATNG
jgi:hypothetical protein